VAYLEQRLEQPAGDYSPTFLELDARSGPWLVQGQKESVVARGDYSDFDLDLEQGLIQFRNKQRVGVVARMEVLGTYAPDDGTWLWAWSNPKLAQLSQGAAKVRDEHDAIPELCEPTFKCTETKAWSVAAAAAFEMQAQTCYRLPGEIQTFVALFEVTELDPDDPRARQVEANPEEALNVLAEYAGPTALTLGGWLVQALRDERETLEEIIGALHNFGENLGEIATSPLGQGTPAAEDAQKLAGLMRQAAMMLAVPRESENFEKGVKEVLTMLQHVAQNYGAVPGAAGDQPARE
jgi:hypothetical protein